MQIQNLTLFHIKLLLCAFTVLLQYKHCNHYNTVSVNQSFTSFTYQSISQWSDSMMRQCSLLMELCETNCTVVLNTLNTGLYHKEHNKLLLHILVLTSDIALTIDAL